MPDAPAPRPPACPQTDRACCNATRANAGAAYPSQPRPPRPRSAFGNPLSHVADGVHERWLWRGLHAQCATRGVCPLPRARLCVVILQLLRPAGLLARFIPVPLCVFFHFDVRGRLSVAGIRAAGPRRRAGGFVCSSWREKCGDGARLASPSSPRLARLARSTPGAAGAAVFVFCLCRLRGGAGDVFCRQGTQHTEPLVNSARACRRRGAPCMNLSLLRRITCCSA